MRYKNASDELRSYADSLLAEAGSTAAAGPRLAGVRPPASWWRSPSFALASLSLIVFGNIGMAAAADSAVPGDLLYPIDRVYESVAGFAGMNIDGHAERMQEASVLLARGDFALAVETIARSVAAIDKDLAASVEAVSASLEQPNIRNARREELHKAVAALVDAARGITEEATGQDRAIQRQAVKDRARVVAEVAQGGTFTPPGQDDNFTPPGLDDNFTPPGLDDNFTPPGQDDNFTPPGQDDNFTPPGLNDKSTPPGLNDNFTPPGQDNESTPPGQDNESTPPGQDNESTPPGLDDKSTPPGQDNKSTPPGQDNKSTPPGQARNEGSGN